jgi:DmsE family decaheme c-type cytochrome
MIARWVPLAAASVGLAFSLSFASSGGAQSAAPSEAVAQSNQSEFVGAEACATCHVDTAAAFKKTPHAANEHACETCHGPGKAHVDGSGDTSKIRNLKAMSPQESSAVCMGCHNKAGQKHFVGSTHDTRNVGCITCHNPHPEGAVVPKALLRKGSQLELCTGCHLQKKAQLMRSGHMPLREGKLVCTSCHNPHGTPNDKMLLQTSVQQNCYSCHAEKRGPFLWEHPPVRENCVNCHDAHGTINEKLLKVKMPLLCQQCHQTASHPGPAYPAMSRYAFNQSCLHCHVAIHGSTHPSGNRFFR